LRARTATIEKLHIRKVRYVNLDFFAEHLPPLSKNSSRFNPNLTVPRSASHLLSERGNSCASDHRRNRGHGRGLARRDLAYCAALCTRGSGASRYVPDLIAEEIVLPGRTPRAFLRQHESAVTEATVLQIGTALILMVFIFQEFTMFLMTYLESPKNVNQGIAVSLFSLFVSGVVFQVMAGHSADVYGQRRMLAGVAVANGGGVGCVPAS
jgi:hypothetical protein